MFKYKICAYKFCRKIKTHMNNFLKIYKTIRIIGRKYWRKIVRHKVLKEHFGETFEIIRVEKI